MDSAYKSFYALVLTGIAALCYRVLLLAPEWAKDPQYGPYVYSGVAIVLWFLFVQSRNIASFILAVLPSLRRLLAWNNFIEGDWPLVVIDRTTGQMMYYGFLTVAYKGGYLVVSGDDWNPDGSHAVAFKSMQTYYSENTLHYWYMQGEGGRQRGYTFIEFFPRSHVATHFTGVFHDKEHPDVRFYGRKQNYKWFARRLKTMGARRAAAEAYAAEVMPRVPVMLKNAVDIDWE